MNVTKSLTYHYKTTDHRRLEKEKTQAGSAVTLQRPRHQGEGQVGTERDRAFNQWSLLNIHVQHSPGINRVERSPYTPALPFTWQLNNVLERKRQMMSIVGSIPRDVSVFPPASKEHHPGPPGHSDHRTSRGCTLYFHSLMDS